LLGLGGVGSAWADHGSRVHFGVVVGPAWGPGWYGPAPYYYPPYYPPVVIERMPPPVYIEQSAPQPAVAVPPAAVAPPPPNYWYYCEAAKAYYPYVKECPAGWQRVAPKPAGQP